MPGARGGQRPRPALRVLARLLGFRETSRPGSNARRFLGRLTALLTVILSVEIWFLWLGPDLGAANWILPHVAVSWAVFFLVFVVATPVLVLRDRDFKLNTNRLVYDIVLSAVFSILAFALLYRQFGIVPGAAMQLRPGSDDLYFSMVTFSTLGFGDFRPDPRIRLYAAFEGLWGNIHLGLLAGAVFYALSDWQKTHKAPQPSRATLLSRQLRRSLRRSPPPGGSGRARRRR